MRRVRICGFWRLRLVLVCGSLLSHRNNAMSPNAEHHGLIPLPYNIKAVVLYIGGAVLYKKPWFADKARGCATRQKSAHEGR